MVNRAEYLPLSVDSSDYSISQRIPELTRNGRIIRRTVRSATNAFRFLENIYMRGARVRYPNLSILEKNAGSEELNIQAAGIEKLKLVYQRYCNILRGHPHGFGTCYVRTFFATKSLLENQFHGYKHNARVTVDPRDYMDYFHDSEIFPVGSMPHQFQDNTVLLFARPLEGKVSRWLNDHFFKNTEHQLSHVCSGIVIDGQIYVLELSGKKLDHNVPDTVIYEPLEQFQRRLQSSGIPQLNLVIAVGQLHPNLAQPAAYST